jgi:hypothetical protein
MSHEIAIAALFKTRLWNALCIEEADNIGKQRRLGINPLGIGLKIKPADAKRLNAFCCFRVELLAQLDSRGSCA